MPPYYEKEREGKKSTIIFKKQNKTATRQFSGSRSPSALTCLSNSACFCGSAAGLECRPVELGQAGRRVGAGC